MPELARHHPDQPEEEIPPYSSLPSETELDKPTQEEVLPKAIADSRGLALPPIILGCAPFGYGIYAQKDQVLSDAPLRTVRLALRAGITAFDTAPWYHPSEIILGHSLKALSDEFPRESYQIITKVGKFGPDTKDHVYESDVVKRSVERSLKRLHTDHLDIVYLHDCEFVCDPPRPKYGSPLDILNDPSLRKEYGLEPPFESHGAGDQAVLDSLNALRDLKKEGKIRFIGLAGFPLPVLLRLSLLAKNTGPFEPVDIVQTYSHQTVQNSTLGEGYLEAFQQAGVGRVTNAAPLAMGSLTTSGGPEWHPCRPTPIFEVTREASKLCQERGTSIEEVACNFGYRELSMRDPGGAEVSVPVVVGCKNLEEVHMSLRSFANANKGLDEKSQQIEKDVRDLFEQRGVRNVSYYNGPSEYA